jgi:hypothetical protein
MKTDRKLLIAVLLLIGLVSWLLLLSINKDKETETIRQTLNELLNKRMDIPKDGKTPVLGIDYLNGVNATDDQVQKAVYAYMDAHPIKNGTNGLDAPTASDGASAYQLAIVAGFTGTMKEWLDSLKIKGDKGDTAPELDIDCQNGYIAKKYSTDSLWQLTNIKCEITNE